MRRIASVLFVTLFVTASTLSANPKPEDTWPGFRGHDMSGIAPGAGIPGNGRRRRTSAGRWTCRDRAGRRRSCGATPSSSPRRSVASRSSSRRLASTATSTSPSCRRRGSRAKRSCAACAPATTNRRRSPTRSATWSMRSTPRPARSSGSVRRTGEAVRRPPSQEHLRVRDAVHRWRAALRLVRPERRPVLLLARRDAAVEEALAAAADLSRLRHGLVTGRA